MTRIVALLTEGSVKVLDKRAMPGEELAGEVDLLLCWIVVRE